MSEREDVRAHILAEREDARFEREDAREEARARRVAEGEDARARRVAEAERSAYLYRRIDNLRDQAREYRRMRAETDNPTSTRAIFYQEEEHRIVSEIEAIEHNLVGTPTRQNTTPRS